MTLPPLDREKVIAWAVARINDDQVNDINPLRPREVLQDLLAEIIVGNLDAEA
jgi:hypothetical protein